MSALTRVAGLVGSLADVKRDGNVVDEQRQHLRRAAELAATLQGAGQSDRRRKCRSSSTRYWGQFLRSVAARWLDAGDHVGTRDASLRDAATAGHAGYLRHYFREDHRRGRGAGRGFFYPKSFVGGAKQVVASTSRALTVKVSEVTATGTGSIAWAPDGRHPVVTWEYTLEND